MCLDAMCLGTFSGFPVECRFRMLTNIHDSSPVPVIAVRMKVSSNASKQNRSGVMNFGMDMDDLRVLSRTLIGRVAKSIYWIGVCACLRITSTIGVNCCPDAAVSYIHQLELTHNALQSRLNKVESDLTNQRRCVLIDIDI